MNRDTNEVCRKLLLAAPAQLRGEVDLLLDTSLDVDISAGYRLKPRDG